MRRFVGGEDERSGCARRAKSNGDAEVKEDGRGRKGRMDKDRNGMGRRVHLQKRLELCLECNAGAP